MDSVVSYESLIGYHSHRDTQDRHNTQKTKTSKPFLTKRFGDPNTDLVSSRN